MYRIFERKNQRRRLLTPSKEAEGIEIAQKENLEQMEKHMYRGPKPSTSQINKS